MDNKERNLDFVFCVDATGSMGHWIEGLKEFLSERFLEILNKVNEQFGNPYFKQARIRFVFFRDYDFDEEPMRETRFYHYPEELHSIIRELDNTIAYGGGDIRENGLEALHLAAKSDWSTGPRDRQIIVLISDADYLLPVQRQFAPNYPKDMPLYVEDLIKEITYNPATGKRIKRRAFIFLVPEDTNYSTLDFTGEGFDYTGDTYVQAMKDPEGSCSKEEIDALFTGLFFGN